MRLAFLLRGINVGGHRKVPMADLRDVAASIGLANAATYVASGNLVARSETPARVAGDALEAAIVERFGFAVDVVVRDEAAWARYLADDPFPDVEAPSRVLLYLPQNGAPADAVERLRARLTGDERAAATEDGAWVFHADGAGRSKLTPNAIDAAFGSPTTGRNLRTVRKVGEMLEAVGA